MSWHIQGSYFESCNCDPICPCRTVNAMTGGRSTHGICMGVLSWIVDEGTVDGVEVTGLAIALALRYSDDEPGSPWTWVLYIDQRAGEEQRRALEDIFTGRLGGDANEHFPWVWKPSNLLAVRPAEIEVDHTKRRQRLRVSDHVEVRIRDRYQGDEQVTCVIPGHDRPGEELVADELRVDDDELDFSFRDTCGYAASFDYSG